MLSLDALVCLTFFVIQLGTYGATVGSCKPGTPRRLVSGVAIVALLYPFGEMLQEFHGVPQFIRWHLSDFGYVPYQAIAIYSIYSIYKWVRNGGGKGISNHFKNTQATIWHTVLVYLVLFAVTIYELFVDSTDVVDVFMYFAGAFIALTVYKKLGECLKDPDSPSSTLIIPSIVR